VREIVKINHRKTTQQVSLSGSVCVHQMLGWESFCVCVKDNLPCVLENCKFAYATNSFYFLNIISSFSNTLVNSFAFLNFFFVKGRWKLETMRVGKESNVR
jgi:hypothetical protein